MKIIDLLNKIANGEEVPKKIKIKGVYHRDFDENDYPIDVEDDYIWELDESYRDEKDYCCGEKDLFQTYLINRILNNEIEVIEDKKIKSINNFISNVGKVDDYNIEEYIHKLFEQETILYFKINEIIDKLNKEK